MNLLFPSSSRLAPDRRLPEGSRQTPVIGWRSWRLHKGREGVELASLFGSERWEVGVTRARCRCCPPWMPASHHPVPSVSCACGLHAYSNFAESMRDVQRRAAKLSSGCGLPPAVVGAVAGWGRIVQHGRQGWRAEYARPVALLDTGHQILEEVALRYGLPLVTTRGMCVLPLEYGDTPT